MKQIEAAKFKEQCLVLLDQFDAEGLIVTKRGEPVARVLPYEGGRRADRRPATQDRGAGRPDDDRELARVLSRLQKWPIDLTLSARCRPHPFDNPFDKLRACPEKQGRFANRPYAKSPARP